MDYNDSSELDIAGGFAAEDESNSPTWMLRVAGGAVGMSALLLVPGPALLVNVFGYVLASVVCFSLVALFRRASSARLVRHGVGIGRPAGSATVGITAAGFLLVCIHAYLIARHYA